MKKYLIIGAVAFACVFMANAARAACTANQIDVTGDGTNCQPVKFSVTTTANQTTLQFKMTAIGDDPFYVDCGNGGTLSQSGTTTGSTYSGKTITRTDVTKETTYTCTWGSGAVQTVKFGGTATNYNTGTSKAAITFYTTAANAQKVASVSGNMSAMFPKINAGATGAQPRFYRTFYKATNLTNIDENLFANYTTTSTYMFASTFYGCTGLTSIPAGLFSGITTGAQNMFSGTFYGCTGLTSIPADLFSGITTGAQAMFGSTFYGCTGLTSIPADLFSGITTAANYMFASTFQGCKGLTSVPAGLFSGITTAADYMFQDTFNGCTGLTSIPAGLFSGITTGAQSMFYYTFNGCTGLTSIPAGLFSGITTGAANMFNSTFYGCTNITGYIPKSTFAGLIGANSPTATSMWTNTFNNTKLGSTCPENTTTVSTTYQGTTSGTQWGNYAMCEAPTGPATNAIPTSQSYVTTEINKLQNKFAGSGANKLMTYPSQLGGTPGSRDIVTTLGTPNATTGDYSNTTDTTIATTGAINTAIDAKQSSATGTPDYVMTYTATAGTTGEKAIYNASTAAFTDALVDATTLNTAVANAVNAEFTRVDKTGNPSNSGSLWQINSTVPTLITTVSE